MPASPDTPYFLVAPVGWQTAMEVKRLFADAEPKMPVVGAASVEAAINRLEEKPRCVAVLIHFAEQSKAAIELMCRMKERWRRPVVAFHPAWHRDDVRRALQLGADCLLGWPFAPGEVLGDLQALQRDGVSLTRKALLERGGPELIQPDPALWNESDDDWRGRLSTLAERLRAPSSDAQQGRVTRLDPAEALNRAVGGPLDPHLAAATVAGMRAGVVAVPRIATEYGVDARRLEQTVTAVLDVADEGQRAGIMALLDDLARSAVVAQDAGVMVQLRRAAQVTLQAGGAHSGGNEDLLSTALSRATGVPVAALAGLSNADRVEVAGRLVVADDDEEVLAQVRLTIFAALVRQLGERRPAPHDLAAMSALLGLRPGVSGIRPPELVRLLARLDPPQALHDVDLTRLAPLRDAVPRPGNALDQLLGRALDELIRAAEPMGLIDQTRFVGLLRSLKEGSQVLVGPVTWRAIAALIGGQRGPAADDERAVKLARRIERLLGVGASDARVRVTRALVELAGRQRNPMDVSRFIAWCRDAAAGVIATAAPPIDQPPGASVLDGLHRVVEPPPATRSGPLLLDPRGPATRSGPMAALAQPVTTSGAMAALARTAANPPAASTRGASAGRTAADPPDWLTRMADAPNASAPGVLALLERGDLDGARGLAAGLADEDPATFEVLNRVALALFVAGRPAEADPLWTRAAALAPSSPNILFHLARLRFEQGRLAEARLLVRQVLALRPHLTPARALHGRIEEAGIRP